MPGESSSIDVIDLHSTTHWTRTDGVSCDSKP